MNKKSMVSNPIFSIVIPTRNRLRTLTHCLATCLNQVDSPPYEIVINDNSDNDETLIYIDKLLKDNPSYTSKISYHKRPHVCSMSENFEEAVARSTGNYVIVIGDDDGILPLALTELYQLILDRKAKVIRWANALYTWPDLTFNDYSNYLGFSLKRTLNSLEARLELLKSISEINYVNLPMLYVNSAVHRDVIDAMRGREGRLFRSRAPDVYSSIVLSYICGEFLDVSVPFTIAGLSNSSNGVSASFAGDNPGPRRDFSNLNEKAGLLKHPYVPDLTIFPFVDFAESFYFAKQYNFPLDDDFTLSRKAVLRACAERIDTSDEIVQGALYAACADAPSLSDYVTALIHDCHTIMPEPRLKPLNLGADGANLHLDAQQFGVETIEDAVNLVHKFIWPDNASLRYDLGG